MQIERAQIETLLSELETFKGKLSKPLAKELSEVMHRHKTVFDDYIVKHPLYIFLAPETAGHYIGFLTVALDNMGYKKGDKRYIPIAIHNFLMTRPKAIAYKFQSGKGESKLRFCQGVMEAIYKQDAPKRGSYDYINLPESKAQRVEYFTNILLAGYRAWADGKK